MERFVRVLLIVSIVAFAGARARAQVTTATIFGTVTDQSHAVVPGATVTATNVETSITRTVVTDVDGRYRLPNLPLGKYAVHVELVGFETVVRSGIELTLGREAEVSVAMAVGDVHETVQVRGEAALVDTSRSQLADLVDQQQIRELPLNARSYTDLALLQPGVMTTSRSGDYTGTAGGGVKLAISGARPMNTGFFVDGMDVKDPLGRTPGSAAGTTLGVDTIQEFQVLVSSFSAQYGGSGGVINSVTKSGTNVVHGDGFYFLRRNALDAANAFDVGGKTPPFSRNQGGFTLGGPIVKSRTFFFVSYEKLQQSLTTTTTITVPGAGLRAGITPTGVVTVNPLTAKFLAAMPLPNGLLFSDGTGQYIGTQTQPTDQDYTTAKVDHQFTDRDGFFVRYTRDKATTANPLAFNGFTNNADTYYQYFSMQHDRILSPSLLNTLRFSLNRSRGTTVNAATGFDSSYNLVTEPGRVPAQLVVPGIASWGNDGRNDREATLTSFQYSEKLTWTHGRQTIVGGADFTNVHFDSYSASRLNGMLQFNSLNDFLIGKPLSWQYLVPGTGAMRYFRQQQFAGYAQDDVKLRSNLTLNVGLRYDVVTTPTEKNGQISNLNNFTDPIETVGGPLFVPSKTDFGPRGGIVWDPTGSGKTSLRAGAGVFRQPLTFATWAFAATQQGPYFLRASIDNPSYPPPITSATLPPGNPTPMTVHPNTPYYQQFNVTLQQQIGPTTVASVSYSGSRGYNLASAENFNVAQFQVLADGSKFWPAGATRINPNYATIETRGFDTKSAYDALQLRLSKRFGAGLEVQSSYTFAKNMDDTSETVSAGISDAYDINRDWGLSQWDVRNNWVVNYIYKVPFGQDRSGVIAGIFGGWETSGILTVTTGNPLTVLLGFNRSRNLNALSSLTNSDRPNLVPGASTNPVLGGPNQYADPAAFSLPLAGTQGDLGRNTLIGPGLATFDLSLLKNVPFGPSRSIQLRASFFNVFNQVNYGNPNTTIFTSAAGTPSPSFGRITSTSTTARQIQLAVKMLF